MKNDKKRMLLAGVLALSVLTGCSSASAASATSSMAASMAAASPAASSEVVSQPETAEGVVLPIAQGSLEEMKKRNEEKAKILYDFLDSSKLLHEIKRWMRNSLLRLPRQVL